MEEEQEMKKTIDHFVRMREQSESNLSPNRKEMGDWHRGHYSGEIMAYGHCIEYLRRHMANSIGKETRNEENRDPGGQGNSL